MRFRVLESSLIVQDNRMDVVNLFGKFMIIVTKEKRARKREGTYK